MKFYSKLAAATALVAFCAPAMAADFVVDSAANSSTGGTGLNTGLTYSAGDVLTVSAALDDLWSAGALPRWSNADGLTGPLFATGTDESGAAAGTQIGASFGTWSQAGLSAPYGSLVGRLGGVYQLLGTNFSGPAWASGTLELFYWDSNNGDNSGRVTAHIAAAGVPEPASWALMLGGFGMVGGALRSRRRLAVRFG